MKAGKCQTPGNRLTLEIGWKLGTRSSTLLHGSLLDFFSLTNRIVPAALGVCVSQLPFGRGVRYPWSHGNLPKHLDGCRQVSLL